MVFSSIMLLFYFLPISIIGYYVFSFSNELKRKNLIERVIGDML